MVPKNDENLKQDTSNEEQLSLEDVVVLNEDLAAQKAAKRDGKRPAKRQSVKDESNAEDEQLTLDHAVVLDEDLAAKKERRSTDAKRSTTQKRSGSKSTAKKDPAQKDPEHVDPPQKNTTQKSTAKKAGAQKSSTQKRSAAKRKSTSKPTPSEGRSDASRVVVGLPELDELLGSRPQTGAPQSAPAGQSTPESEAAPIVETVPAVKTTALETAASGAFPEGAPPKRKTTGQKKATGQKRSGQKASEPKNATGAAKYSTAEHIKSDTPSHPAEAADTTEKHPVPEVESTAGPEISTAPESVAASDTLPAAEAASAVEKLTPPKRPTKKRTHAKRTEQQKRSAPSRNTDEKRAAAERPAREYGESDERYSDERQSNEQRPVALRVPEPKSSERRPVQSAPAKRIVPTEERMPRERTVRMRGRKPSFTRETLLYSGETVATATSRITREFGALILSIAVLFGVFWVKDKAVEFYTGLDYSIVYNNVVTDEPVYAQLSAAPQLVSSGYAAAQIVSTQMGGQVNTKKFTRGQDETVFPSEVIDCLTDALPDNDVRMESGLSNRDLLIAIHESLADNRPVIVLLGEPSGLHYGVVTAMDANRNFVSVVDPSTGVAGQYIIEDFLDATRFEAYLDMPFSVRLGLTLGSWSRNTAIFVE